MAAALAELDGGQNSSSKCCPMDGWPRYQKDGRCGGAGQGFAADDAMTVIINEIGKSRRYTGTCSRTTIEITIFRLGRDSECSPNKRERGAGKERNCSRHVPISVHSTPSISREHIVCMEKLRLGILVQCELHLNCSSPSRNIVISIVVRLHVPV